MNQHKQIWDKFCTRMQIYETSVPLFLQAENRMVETKIIGATSQRSILCRSTQMEQMHHSLPDNKESTSALKHWNTYSSNLSNRLSYPMIKMGIVFIQRVILTALTCIIQLRIYDMFRSSLGIPRL